MERSAIEESVRFQASMDVGFEAEFCRHDMQPRLSADVEKLTIVCGELGC